VADLAAALEIRAEAADELLESLVDAGLLTRAETAGRYRVSTLVSVFAAGIRRDTAHSAAPPTVPRARQGEPQRARHVAQRPGQSHGVRI
jgi:DNA-binding IclR family transcriptional regulator